MKKLLVVFLMTAVFALGAMAQVTPIYDIQYTEDESGDSPLIDQEVTISGIITGEAYAFESERYWVQDANQPWSGIQVYDDQFQAAEGDSVTLTGTVSEYYGLTQIGNVTSFTIEKEGVFGIEPFVVTSGEIGTGGENAEAFESCLVRVENADIAEVDLGHGEWSIDDGSGPVRIDDRADYYFDPAKFDGVESLVGLLDYSFNDTKIQPRLAYDIKQAGPFTRVHRIQQVRYSDLMKAPYDQESDISYLQGDTLTVRGIVTMPTGLSYAGDGIKFIFGDKEGGPWSAILSYNADSTAYPALFEGDEIEMTGYIDEYTTGPSNMTEFFITSPINITNFGQAIPDADSIATGDLRWPTEAEQWGNVTVRVGQAVVTDVNPQYELFAVNDGSGDVLVDDDSDSLSGYQDPPLGAEAEMIRGWVYHHYGDYGDSSAYKLEPFYPSDIVWGASPPAVSGTMRDMAVPGSADDVTVTSTIETSDSVAVAEIYYSVDEGDWMTVEMEMVDETTFSGVIPAQAAGSFVQYYVKAEDTQGQVGNEPADIKLKKFGYPVKDEPTTIYDIQYSPWQIADSPLHGYDVEVEGIVTVDTSYYNTYGGYVIQDGTGAWNGVYVFGALPAMSRGDKVKVFGTVSDYNPDWHYKWDNNTTILADSVQVLATGETVAAPEAVSTSNLAQDSPFAEQYEGCLVNVQDVVLVGVNGYDVSISDGSGECLLDADGVIAGDNNPNDLFFIDADNNRLIVQGDTINVGENMGFTKVEGVFTFSFGTYKIELRDMSDLGMVTSVEDDIVAAPLTYELQQNFPNPFNPETRIYFQVPNSENVTLVVYNMLGQQVRKLADQQFQAGRHVINWDGRNDAGLYVPSGVYIYRIKAGNFIDFKKMTLLK